MPKTISLTTVIPLDRSFHITLPADVPTGPAEVTLTVSVAEDGPEQTLGDLAKSEFIGMWRDREDITDSAEFARHLRRQAWDRSR